MPDTSARNRSSIPWLLLVLVLIIALPIGYDFFTVAQPAAAALASDPRNAGFSLSVHRQYRVNPSVLVIDLRSADAAAPVDLLRGVFTVAEIAHDRDLQFDQVQLLRSGTPVFLIDGKDFAEIGAAYAGGENPAYLVRTFPEKLSRPDGTSAFQHWEGGILGVLAQQMQDVSAAARQWAYADR